MALAKSLNLETTGEGIETSDQLEALRALGSDRGQGYLFSRPMPACDLDLMVADRYADDGVVTRGGLLTGTAGGRLLAIDTQSGTVGWDATGCAAAAWAAASAKIRTDMKNSPIENKLAPASSAQTGPSR